jgi:uncharacterized protein YbjT (DUF2867 family)
MLSGADAVVFAAGAGPGSGIPRKDSVDRAGSVLMADAAQQAGVRRFVQVSSMGAGSPPQAGRGEVWAAYIAAKTAAEADLRSRDLDWTILRPGHLTDDPAAGRVRLAAPPVPAGAVSRADVAAVIAALLHEPGTSHQTLELVGGDTPSPRPCTASPDHNPAPPHPRRASPRTSLRPCRIADVAASYSYALIRIPAHG